MNRAQYGSFIFDSEKLDYDERFDAYRNLYSGGSDVSVSGDAFRAHVEAQKLGKIVVFERRLNDVMHERSARRAGVDGLEHFTLQLNLSGRLVAEVPSGMRDVAPGEIILFNMTRPQQTILKNAHLLTFSVALDVVEAASLEAPNLHGNILAGPKAGLLADLMVSLVRRRISDEPDAISGATQMFHQALALALNGHGVSVSDNPNDALQRVKLLIESRLTARELSPDWLARSAGLSRTRLYDLFKPLGGISRYIQKRRASRLRALLTRSETRNLPIGTLSLQAGFASESHAIRTFSEHFNLSPGQHRRAALQLTSSSDISRNDEFDAWIKALN